MQQEGDTASLPKTSALSQNEVKAIANEIDNVILEAAEEQLPAPTGTPVDELTPKVFVYPPPEFDPDTPPPELTTDIIPQTAGGANYQEDLSTRVAKLCRKQRGILLFHSMGSGKTRTALLAALNLVESMRDVDRAGEDQGKKYMNATYKPNDPTGNIINPVLIITPKALDTPWKDEATKLGLFGPTVGNRYTGWMSFMEYSQIESIDLGDIKDSQPSKDTLLKRFSGRVVILDEAHNLLPLMKDSETLNKINTLFAKTRRNIFLSGTPFQTNITDIAKLINTCMGIRVLPTVIEGENQFNETFEVQKRKRRIITSIVGNAEWLAKRALVLAAITAALPALPLGVMATASSLTALWGTGLLNLELGLAATLAVMSLAGAYRVDYDSTKLGKTLAKYTSFFDYEKNLSPQQLIDFPLKIVNEVPEPYSDSQLAMYIRILTASNVIDDLVLTSMLGENDTDLSKIDPEDVELKFNAITTRDDYLQKFRQIGNISPWCYLFTPKRGKTQIGRAPNRYGNTWAWPGPTSTNNGTFYAVTRKITQIPNRGVRKAMYDSAKDVLKPIYQLSYDSPYWSYMPAMGTSGGSSLVRGTRRTRGYGSRKRLLGGENGTTVAAPAPTGAARKRVAAAPAPAPAAAAPAPAAAAAAAAAPAPAAAAPAPAAPAPAPAAAAPEPEPEPAAPAPAAPAPASGPSEITYDGKRLNVCRVFEVGKFLKAKELIIQCRKRYHFLPLIYSCFDKWGFQIFSAYLNSIGFQHIVIHADDPASWRDAEFDFAKQPYPLLGMDYNDDNEYIGDGNAPLHVPKYFKEIKKGGYYKQDKIYEELVKSYEVNKKGNLDRDVDEATYADRKARFLAAKVVKNSNGTYNDEPFNSHGISSVPMCALLHPSITEGLSFTMAPEMIVMEVPFGVGIRDQIYGRILRKYNEQTRNDAIKDYNNANPTDPITTIESTYRVPKTIHQLITGHPSPKGEYPQALRDAFPQLPKTFRWPVFGREEQPVNAPKRKIVGVSKRGLLDVDLSLKFRLNYEPFRIYMKIYWEYMLQRLKGKNPELFEVWATKPLTATLLDTTSADDLTDDMNTEQEVLLDQLGSLLSKSEDSEATCASKELRTTDIDCTLWKNPDNEGTCKREPTEMIEPKRLTEPVAPDSSSLSLKESAMGALQRVKGVFAPPAAKDTLSNLLTHVHDDIVAGRSADSSLKSAQAVADALGNDNIKTYIQTTRVLNAGKDVLAQKQNEGVKSAVNKAIEGWSRNVDDLPALNEVINRNIASIRSQFPSFSGGKRNRTRRNKNKSRRR